MAALADDGGEHRNGKTTDETHDGDIVGCSRAQTQRNKVSAVVHGRMLRSKECHREQRQIERCYG
jgi:hypothetical protein